MPLYNSAYLKHMSGSKAGHTKESIFAAARKQTRFDVFLSHSYLDRTEVEGLYFELTSLRLQFYVDWIVDPQLDRSNVTKQTAALVRSRMRASKSLLLAVSTNAATSRWMPWELGYMDGFTEGQCAIVPVAPEKRR